MPTKRALDCVFHGKVICSRAKLCHDVLESISLSPNQRGFCNCYVSDLLLWKIRSACCSLQNILRLVRT